MASVNQWSLPEVNHVPGPSISLLNSETQDIPALGSQALIILIVLLLQGSCNLHTLVRFPELTVCLPKQAHPSVPRLAVTAALAVLSS